jgi:hypothetical protein
MFATTLDCTQKKSSQVGAFFIVNLYIRILGDLTPTSKEYEMKNLY